MKSQNASTMNSGYPISDVYSYSGKPIPIDDKNTDKLLFVTTLYQKFKDSESSRYFYDSYDFLLVNTHEVYFHPRKPRAGYTVHKANASYSFIVNEPQDRCRSFCKVLKYIHSEKNPDVKAHNYIEQLLKTEAKEIAMQKENQGDTIILQHRASRIMVDGNQTGYFLL